MNISVFGEGKNGGKKIIALLGGLENKGN